VEFWNVATRPKDRNGFGLSITDADREVQLIEAQLTLLPDNEQTIVAGSVWLSPTIGRHRTRQRLPHYAPVHPELRAIPRTVPSPCSYSRRICSNNSTFALLSNRPPVPGRRLLSVPET
jgi:hypothetical protein